LHAGHVQYLSAAAALADVLIVGLNSDASVRRLKGPQRPVVTELDRAALLNALRVVHFVTIFDEDTPKELIEIIKPDVLVKGGDYTEDAVVGADFVKGYGGSVALIPFMEGRSTSDIITRIRSGS
jgi:D-beta-D-heptose 7-phosphate kinase/D-beta-D-heptose 1-phosphate adenosyltransferase